MPRKGAARNDFVSVRRVAAQQVAVGRGETGRRDAGGAAREYRWLREILSDVLVKKILGPQEGSNLPLNGTARLSVVGSSQGRDRRCLHCGGSRQGYCCKSAVASQQTGFRRAFGVPEMDGDG